MGIFKIMKVAYICLFVILAASAVVNASTRRLLHYKDGKLFNKSDCPKGMSQYKQFCFEKPDGSFKAGNTVEIARPLRRFLLKFHASLEDWGQKKHQLLLKKTVQRKWHITRNGAMKTLTVHSRQANTVEIARLLRMFLLNLNAILEGSILAKAANLKH